MVLIALVLGTACEGQRARTTQAAQADTGETTFCEFSLGVAPPPTLRPAATRRVATEGDDRVFFDYRACDGRIPVSVELSGSVVDSISVSEDGSCVHGIACVGDTYQQAIERFPNARRVLTRIEGATFSLLIRDGVTLVFDPEGLPDRCFDHPAECDAEIRQSRIASIALYARRP